MTSSSLTPPDAPLPFPHPPLPVPRVPNAPGSLAWGTAWRKLPRGAAAPPCEPSSPGPEPGSSWSPAVFLNAETDTFFFSDLNKETKKVRYSCLSQRQLASTQGTNVTFFFLRMTVGWLPWVQRCEWDYRRAAQLMSRVTSHSCSNVSFPFRTPWTLLRPGAPPPPPLTQTHLFFSWHPRRS